MSKDKRKCYFGCVVDGALHRFPTAYTFRWEIHQKKRYDQWVKVLDQNTLQRGDEYIKENLYLCSKHFEDMYVLPSGLLTKNAVPTLNKGPKKKIAEVPDKEPIIGTDIKPAADPQDEHIAAPPNDADEQPSTETPATQPSHEDDIRSETDSVVLPEAPVEESVVPEPKNLTWQKPHEVVPVPADDIKTEAVMDNLSMYCDDGDHASLLSEQLDENNKEGGPVSPAPHEVFRCNVCDAVIAGFRYTCVQCSDLDLCGACEAARAHHHHYVLRVPADRLAAEVQLVLAAIRRHLMGKLDPITQHGQDRDDAISFKSEVKSEPEDYEANDNDGDNCNDDTKNKLLEDGVLKRSSSPGPPQHGNFDGEAQSVDGEDEAPRGECGETQRKRKPTKIIYMNVSDYMKIKDLQKIIESKKKKAQDIDEDPLLQVNFVQTSLIDAGQLDIVDSKIVATGAKRDIVPRVLPEATARDVQSNIRLPDAHCVKRECFVKLERLHSQVVTNAGKKPMVSVTADSCDSETTIPSTRTHEAKKRTKIIEQAVSGDTRHTVSAKKRCLSSDLSHETTLHSYSQQHK